jgi:hypothetical protein
LGDLEYVYYITNLFFFGVLGELVEFGEGGIGGGVARGKY